jgi:hypothetical protein
MTSQGTLALPSFAPVISAEIRVSAELSHAWASIYHAISRHFSPSRVPPNSKSHLILNVVLAGLQIIDLSDHKFGRHGQKTLSQATSCIKIKNFPT